MVDGLWRCYFFIIIIINTHLDVVFYMKGHSILRSNKTTIELVQLYIKWILIMHYVNTKIYAL